jgi:hypothetical protein
VDLVVYDDEERRYVPWRTSVAAVVVTGLLAAGLTLAFARSPQTEQPGDDGDPRAVTSSEEPSPTPTPTPTGATGTPSATPSDACVTALAGADAVAARSAALEQFLTEHTRIMDDLLAQRITTDQALAQTLPVLTRAATQLDFFEDELAAYRSSRAACTE